MKRNLTLFLAIFSLIFKGKSVLFISKVKTYGFYFFPAIKLALKHKDNLAALASIEEIETTLGKRIGAVWLLRVLAERLGIT
jgi:hypothetical protein